MNISNSIRAAVAALACAAAVFLAAPQPASAISAADRPEIEKMIREYLIANPEVIRDAMIELQRRQAAEEAKERAAAVKNNRELIFESPRGVTVGNPKGDVAVVEFFDYNCGYCKRALDDMMQMMKADPKVKFVLKEFPVLGQASLDAAKVSIAVRMQDESGKKYLDFHERLLATRGQVDGARARAVAKEVGLDMARIERDLKSDEIEATLLESMALADALGISGTPSYVIGNQVVPGAVGTGRLTQHVENVRKCGDAVC